MLDRSGTSNSIGIRALLPGTSFLDRDPRVRPAHPVLVDLSASLGETAHLARLDRGQVVHLDTVESREYPRAMPRVGRRLPALHTALGRAILAHSPGHEPEILAALCAARDRIAKSAPARPEPSTRGQCRGPSLRPRSSLPPGPHPRAAGRTAPARRSSPGWTAPPAQADAPAAPVDGS